MTNVEKVQRGLRGLMGTHGEKCNVGPGCVAIQDGNTALAALSEIEQEQSELRKLLQAAQQTRDAALRASARDLDAARKAERGYSVLRSLFENFQHATKIDREEADREFYAMRALIERAAQVVENAWQGFLPDGNKLAALHVELRAFLGPAESPNSLKEAFSMSELKQAIEDQVSDEADVARLPLSIYHCDDCGGRIAAQIINGPTEPMPHHYLAAGGGKRPFLGCCPICGGTMFHEITPGAASSPTVHPEADPRKACVVTGCDDDGSELSNALAAMPPERRQQYTGAIVDPTKPHQFEAVGPEFPNTCVHCACFWESVNHKLPDKPAVCLRCGDDKNQPSKFCTHRPVYSENSPKPAEFRCAARKVLEAIIEVNPSSSIDSECQVLARDALAAPGDCLGLREETQRSGVRSLCCQGPCLCPCHKDGAEPRAS